ncbi:MAG TPA: DUF2339 domain-containing protein [Bryobacteraceae bacterium]
MTGPDSERLEAISEGLARLVVRQAQMERRLDELARRLGVTGATEAPAEPPPMPVTASPLEIRVPDIEVRPAPESAPAAPAFESAMPPTLESRMGMVWVNRAGVVTVVLAVTFFFKYAVDNRWIGETGRVLLGVLAGLAALAAAERFRRAGQRIFAQGICGAGVATLYVSIYTAYGFYHLLPHGSAFGLMALITAGAGALAVRHGSPAMAALGLIGGYLTPVVLSTGEDRPWAFLGYVLLLSAGGMALARLREWRVLEALAFAAATLLYWSWIAEFHKSDTNAATVYALAYFALFAAARLRAVAAVNQAAGVVALLAASAPGALPGLPLAVLLLAAGLVSSDGRRWRALALVSLAAFWLPYAAAHFTFKEQNAAAAVLVPLTGAFAAALGWLLWRARRGLAPGTQELALVALSAGCYFTAAYDLLAPHHRAWLGLFALALALAHLAAARDLRRFAREALLLAGIALSFTTLAIPIQFAGYRIAVAWALEGAALAWIAARSREARLAAVAPAVLALAVLRVLAVDSHMYSSTSDYALFANARFLAFAATATALWFTVRSISHIRAAASTYICGHLILLWGLSLEVLAWAERNAPAPDVANLQSAAISILLAAYAVILVAAGVARRTPLNRILGLALLALVVMKLYLFDVWRITRGMYRVAAFAGLGVLLLITSYLYSRFRDSVEAWWRKEP